MYPNLTGPKNQPPDSPALAREKIRSLSRLRGLNVLPLTLESVAQAMRSGIVVPIDEEIAISAADLFIRHKLPLADSLNRGRSTGRWRGLEKDLC